MGRPKTNAAGLSAKEKIEEAFWKILEYEDFRNITILRLTQETGLNRNTIYYHYQNIDDIAKKAIEHNMEKQDVDNFASSIFFSHKNYSINSNFLLHMKRLHLLAGSESTFLQSFVKTKLINTWLDYFNINSSELSEIDQVSIEFIASGILSIIGSDTFIDKPELISVFPSSLIGKAAFQTLQSVPNSSLK